MARDVMLVFHGSIALVTPLTEPAPIWVRDNLEHEEAFLGATPSLSSLATWGPIVADMADDGLVIQAE
jgi:hypothetical protein